MIVASILIYFFRAKIWNLVRLCGNSKEEKEEKAPEAVELDDMPADVSSDDSENGEVVQVGSPDVPEKSESVEFAIWDRRKQTTYELKSGLIILVKRALSYVHN